MLCQGAWTGSESFFVADNFLDSSLNSNIDDLDVALVLLFHLLLNFVSDFYQKTFEYINFESKQMFL